MKVSIELSPEYSEPYAIIYADKITDSIQRTLDIFGSNESPITAFKNENDIVILQPKEIHGKGRKQGYYYLWQRTPLPFPKKTVRNATAAWCRIYANFKINFSQSVLYEQCRGWF